MSSPTPARATRTRTRVLGWLAAALLGAAFLGAAWLVATTSGAGWLLARAGVEARGLEGSLLANLRAQSLAFERPGFRLQTKGLAIGVSPVGLLSGRVHIRSVEADDLTLDLASSRQAAAPPAEFIAAIPIEIDVLRIRNVRLARSAGDGAAPPLQMGDVRLEAVAFDRALRIGAGAVTTPFGKVRFRGRMDADRRHALDIAADIEGEREGRRYRVEARARGTIERLEIDVKGAEGGVSGEGAVVFEAWSANRLRAVRGRLAGLDARAFNPLWPVTEASVEANLAIGKDGALAGAVKLSNAGAGPIDRDRLPIQGAEGHLRIDGNRYELTQASFGLAGGGRASGQIRLEGERAEVNVDVAALDLAQWHSSLRPTQLAGRLVARSSAGVQAFEVDLRDARGAVAGRATIDGGLLSVHEVRIARGTSSAALRGTLGLKAPRAFEFSGTLDRVDPSAFTASPAGEISGAFETAGTLDPAPSGRVALKLAPSRFAGLPLSGHIDAASDASGRSRIELALTLSSARLGASGAFGRADDALVLAVDAPDLAPIAKAFGWKLAARGKSEARIRGTLREHSIALEASAADGAGSSVVERRLKLALRGGITTEPVPAWKGVIESLDLAGPQAFALAAPAPLRIARDRAELTDAALRGAWGETRLAVLRWTPGSLETRGTGASLEARTIAEAMGARLAPSTDLRLAAEWDLRLAPSLDGHLRFRRAGGDLRFGDAAEAAGLEVFAASVEAVQGKVRATLDVRGSSIGRIEASAASEWRDGADWASRLGAPLTGSARLEMASIGWASSAFGPEAKLEGRVQGRFTLGGTVGAPRWSGRASAEGLALHGATAGFDVDAGRAAIGIDGREVRIEQFELESAWRPPSRALRRIGESGAARRGTITADGHVDFATATGAIVVRARQFPMSQLASRFLAASGEARLESREGQLAISGSVRADAGWFRLAATAPPAISADVLVDLPQSPRPARERLEIDVRLDLGDNLSFNGRGLSTRLAGEVRVRGEPGRNLAASGSIRTVGGTYEAYGQQLEIQRGALNFQGPIENPALNVLAVRPGLPVVAGVEILGNVAAPRARLYSSPVVPDAEKLSWLVLGRGPAAGSEGDAAALAAAASALLGSGRESRRVLRGLGIDDVRITRSDSSSALGVMPQSTVAGRTGVTGGDEVVSVGKRLTKDIYVSYQQGLTDAQGALHFTLQVTRQLQLLLVAGEKSRIDAVYRFGK